VELENKTRGGMRMLESKRILKGDEEAEWGMIG
jgi:hypothetical protein